MVYNVTGTVTGFEYEDLPAVNVTVKNLRTNESKTSAASATAVYTADLDDAGSFPTAKANGDEIEITCTHRGITRTWKRRVQGTSLPQDIHFTHGTWEGVIRKAKLLLVDVITGVTGTGVTLRDANTRDLLEARKNGTVLATSAYTFTKPRTLTMGQALVNSDVLEVKRAIHRGKEEAQTAVVEEGDAEVRNAMSRHYKDLMGHRIPELQSISEALAAARLRDELHSGGGKEDAEAASLRRFARERLRELHKGERALTDQDDGYVAPTAQSTGVPRSNLTPTRQFNSFGGSTSRRNLW